MLVCEYVCEYVCVSVYQIFYQQRVLNLCSEAGGLVIMLNSIRLGKVCGAITDQTAGKQTIITL